MEQKSTNNEAMKLMVETITLHTHYLTSLNCLAKMENSALLKKKKYRKANCIPTQQT